MAPPKTRSASPTGIPQWVVDLLQETQRLRSDFRQQDSAIREIRSITLENQHMLRTRFQDSMASLTSVHTSTSVNRTARTPITSTVTSVGQTNNLLQRTSRSTNSNRMVISLQNQAIRNAAVAIPKPSVASSNRICWYHRQFGQTSANCIPPCGFKPSLPVQLNKGNQPDLNSQLKPINKNNPINTSANENGNIVQPNNVIEQLPPKTTPEVADWTAEDDLDIQYFRLSSSSSSESSSSSDEEENTANKRPHASSKGE